MSEEVKSKPKRGTRSRISRISRRIRDPMLDRAGYIYETKEKMKEFIQYMNENDKNVNDIDKTDTFKNTLFLWLIFNCSPKPVQNFIKYKNMFKYKLDINKPSQFGPHLSPLQAAILKGRYRICGDTSRTLGKSINLLLKDEDIDITYKNKYGHDALYYALLLFDLDSIELILKKQGYINPKYIKMFLRHLEYIETFGKIYIFFINCFIEYTVVVFDPLVEMKNVNEIIKILNETPPDHNVILVDLWQTFNSYIINPSVFTKNPIYEELFSRLSFSMKKRANDEDESN